MSLINILKPDFIFEDERGKLVQLVREGYAQFNIITSAKGVTRGGHYHLKNHEAFYVVQGKISLEVLNTKNPQKREIYIFEGGDMFEIPPLILHSFVFEESTILAGLYDKGVELADGTKDIFNADIGGGN